MTHASRQLFLFTKPAVPGRVKTRLIGALSAEQAAELHQAFVEDVLAELAGGAYALSIAWALAPGEPLPASREPGVRQVGDGLGERLFAALRQAMDHGAAAAAAIGSDHPRVPRAHVEEAFQRLDAGAQVVLGPSEDGGYYLIAVAAAALTPALFQGIDWSTERVFAQTLDRAREAGLAVSLLPTGRDVDTPADLEHLVGELAAHEGACPRTRAVLAAWGRLPAAVTPEVS